MASKGNNSSGGDKKTTAREQAGAAKLDDKGETAYNSIEKKGDPDQKVESMPDVEGTGGYGFNVTAKKFDPPPPVDVRRLNFDNDNYEPSWAARMELKLNRAMEKNWIGRIAEPESSWQGEEGFKNKEWPTIKATVGVLSTILSGGWPGFMRLLRRLLQQELLLRQHN